MHYYVGGATKLYGAALYRLRPEDFGEIKHADGLSPAWPLATTTSSPGTPQAEWLYQVHGAHGEDPTEGPCSKQYPWPAVSHEPRIQQISDALAAAGYHPFHAPCGILLDEDHRPASACIRCAWCDGYPCLVHAKSDAETIAVRPLLDRPERDAAGQRRGACGWRPDPVRPRSVTGVVVSRDGNTEVYAGDIVVVCAGRGQHGPDPAAVGHRPAPAGPGQRLGPARPQLHVPQQQGRGGAQPRGEPTRSTRRPWP